jgi:hypothetical protein
MRDQELRSAVHKKLLPRHHTNPSTLVLDELGINHGRSRIDIAVINGHILGIELKADADTLSRLPSQVDAYNEIVDAALLIVARKHLSTALDLIPDWWGVTIADAGVRGGVKFTSERPGFRNPARDPLAIARLLWRPEAEKLLLDLGLSHGLKGKPREQLYAQLAQNVTLKKLAQYVRDQLKQRKDWRGRQRL